MTNSNQVVSLYRTVVDDVLSNVKEAFLDEGVDEQVLQELRQLWESKLSATKALEAPAEPEVNMTNPNIALLMQEHVTQKSVQHGYVPRGAMLASAPQQPQTLSVSMHQELSGAAAQATLALPVGLFQQQFALAGNVPLQATANGQYIAVQNVGGQQVTFAFPQHLVHQGSIQTTHQIVNQPHGNPTQSGVIQLDGNGDGSSSSDDEDFDNEENEDDAEEDQNEDEGDQGEEEEPLNSADDVSEEDPTELFDSENVVVCQYDKINRNKNKWKFHLKDGIMNLNGRDFVFQRANGDAEW